MSETIPTNTPATVYVGDTFKWRLRTVVNGEHRDPADSWVLTYELRNSNAIYTLTGTDNGDGYHLINVLAATTAAYASGVFHYQAAVTKGAERYIVERGQICIEPDFAQQSEEDHREWAQIVLDAIESVMKGKATSDELSYSIGGRSLSRMSWGELIEARSKLQAEVRAANQASAVAKGFAPSGIIRTRI